MVGNPPAMHPVLEAAKQIIPGLAKTLGDDAEVVLHEFSHPQDSVVAIEGNITGRKVGAPLTDLLLRLVRRGQVDRDVINYSTHTDDGRVLRSSTIFLRDEGGQAIGCLCINIDLTRWIVAKHALEAYCRTEPLDDAPGETFTHDIEALLRANMEQVIEEEGIPVYMMKKEDKIRVVGRLDQRGVFLVKGAVAIVARALDVSRYTIYNYLDEARSVRPEDR